MLHGVDKETGKKLSAENISYQLATFLVAGHETTSATLSFLSYNLIHNPEKLHKAVQQVDEVVGDNVLTVDMLPKLTYIDACIKETLRSSSPINLVNVTSTKDQVLGGKYFVAKDQPIIVLLKPLHHDRNAWGDDVDEVSKFIGKRVTLP
jgi:cytochrome P450 / NADPH-cytochrome P450 reductase